MAKTQGGSKMVDKIQGIDLASYKLVFEKSPVAFAIVKVLQVEDKYDDIYFVYANEAYAKLSSFPVKDLVGHTYSEICGSKSEKWSNLYGKVAFEIPEYATVAYGPEINGYVSMQIQQLKKGYCAVSVLDITQYVSVEKKFTEEFQRKYELVKQKRQHDGKFIAYGVFDLNTNQTIEMEYKKELIDLEDNTDMESFRDKISTYILRKEQRDRYLDTFNKENLLENYEKGVELLTTEFQRKLSSGKVVWVKGEFSLLQDPNTSNVLLFYSCTNINVTKLIEIMSAHIVDVDYDIMGCVNFTDDSCIMLYGKNSSKKVDNVRREERYSEALDWFVNNAIVPEEREIYKPELFMDKIRQELIDKGNCEYIVHIHDRKGELRTKKLHFIDYDLETGICFFTQIDITKQLIEEERRQKELRDALKQAKAGSEAKTEFFSRMSHDLRTPMNGILGLANLSLEEKDPKVIRENLEKINGAGDYLLGIINDTLGFQKIQSGKISLMPKVYYSKDILADVIGILAGAAKAKGVEFKVVNENARLNSYVKVDTLRFKQIIINIVSNAIKFTPPGGTVEYYIKTLKHEKNIDHDMVVIKDNGIGMSKEFLKDGIFKPFSQDLKQDVDNQQGTGLGLSIVKEIVKMMGGTIEVESELGKGTTFTIYLDVETVPENEAKLALKESSVKIDEAKEILKGKHILIAEDQVLNAEVLSKLLKKVGCTVTWCKNGLECLDFFKTSDKGHFAEILMDMRMPIMGGVEATKAIRKLERSDAKTIPIIATTANAYDEDVRITKAAGMNGHIAKPIEPQKLYITMAEVLKK